MRYYVLDNAIVGGRAVKTQRQIFSSRQQAINYMFDYFEDNYLYDLQLSDEHTVNDNKHQIEYVCDHYNRFTITRVNA